MVLQPCAPLLPPTQLSVLALSSRFDGRRALDTSGASRVLSVLALSSRFDGLFESACMVYNVKTFSTRSVESF